MSTDVKAIQGARRELLAAQENLRVWEAVLPLRKAEAEQHVIEAAVTDGRVLGTNETDRKRVLLLELEELGQDDFYRVARSEHEKAVYALEKARTTLEILLDDRRAREWEVRDRLATALLLQAGVPVRVDAGGRLQLGLGEVAELAVGAAS